MPSIEEIPTYLATEWDITTEAAQVFLSIIVLLAVLLPVIILTRGKSMTTTAIMFVFTEVFLVAITWLPFWIVIITVTILAFGIARLGSEFIGG